MLAAENGHADCVRLLLNAGADKNAKNKVCASAVVAVVPVFACNMEVRFVWFVRAQSVCSSFFPLIFRFYHLCACVSSSSIQMYAATSVVVCFVLLCVCALLFG